MNNRYIPKRILGSKPGMRTILLFDEITQTLVVGKHVFHQAHPLLVHQHKTEIEVLGKLRSERMPKLIDVFEDEEGSWLIESRIEGISLSKWLRQKHSRKTRREMFCQIVDRINEVHAAGYAYLDLHTENILIQAGKAFLIDFNGAVLLGSQKPVLGNKDSLLPENGKAPVSEASDQIGLGSLYRKMAGPGWIVRRCLHKNPAKRFRSLHQLQQACRPKNTLRMASAASLCFMSICIPFTSVLSSQEADARAVSMMVRTAENNQSEDQRDDRGKENSAKTNSEQQIHTMSASQIRTVLAKAESEDPNWDEEVWNELLQRTVDLKDPFAAAALAPRIPGSLAKQHSAEMLQLLMQADLEIPEELPLRAVLQTKADIKNEEELQSRIAVLSAAIVQHRIDFNEKIASAYCSLLQEVPAYTQASAKEAAAALIELAGASLECTMPEALMNQLEKNNEGKDLLSLYRRIKKWKELS